MQQTKALNNSNGNLYGNTMYQNSNNSSSSSSLYSAGSTSSSSSSLNSLPPQQPHYDPRINTGYPANYPSFNNINSDQKPNPAKLKNANQDNVITANLKKNLEQVLNQKKLICNQLDELNKKVKFNF